LRHLLLICFCFLEAFLMAETLYWWRPPRGENFGDELSQAIVERMVGTQIVRASLKSPDPTLFALGSIIQSARDNDLVWGSGYWGHPHITHLFTKLDVRAVRGPRTRELLLKRGIICPEVYGDPAILTPLLFTEFQKQEPVFDYIIIPHFTEIGRFKKVQNVVLPTSPWREVVRQILKSRLVIASSLHGLILAEAFGIPARMLRITDHEPLFKYQDYYESTGRFDFIYATSVKEALEMGGEKVGYIDPQPLIDAFPWDYFEQKQSSK
jgi:pyruvyltransferase